MTDTTPNGLLDAFWRYEAALMSNNLGELDRLFAPGPWTLRGDAVGLLVGHDAISAFRAGRGGAPARSVEELHVRAIDDDAAMIVAVVRAASGGRGQQTQLWRRGVDGWQVAVAHVSAPARVIDGTIWRIVGTPLVAGTPGGAAADEADAADAPDSARNAAGDSAGAPEPGLSGREAGSLDGETVAVKDLFAIAGFAVGAGVPAYLAEGRPATETASAVASLLAAGADVVGIARTDEFAYSIAGRNPHYGTPPNAAVPGALPGGSSSGPASAVALGQASIGLATDTGGSIRVPASYQGLWGLRTTHGAVPVDGLLPLAPSFDTVGWLTRDGSTLARAARASIPGVRRELTPRYALVDVSAAFQGEGQAGAGDGEGGEVERAVGEAAARLRAAGIDVDTEPVDVGDLAELAESFRQVRPSRRGAPTAPGSGSIPERSVTRSPPDSGRRRRSERRRRGARSDDCTRTRRGSLRSPRIASSSFLQRPPAHRTRGPRRLSWSACARRRCGSPASPARPVCRRSRFRRSP